MMSIFRMITCYSTLQSADSSEGTFLLLLNYTKNSIRFKNQCQIEHERRRIIPFYPSWKPFESIVSPRIYHLIFLKKIYYY